MKRAPTRATGCGSDRQTHTATRTGSLPSANGRLAHEVLRDVDGFPCPRRPARQDVFPSANQQVEQERVADPIRGGYDDLEATQQAKPCKKGYEANTPHIVV